MRKRIGWMVIDICVMLIMMMTMTMTATKLAVFQPEQFTEICRTYNSANEVARSMQAACFWQRSFFRHMSGLGNVLMFPASTPWSSGLALHLVLASTFESTPQLDASLSRLGRGIECWQSIESEFCEYDTPHKTKKSWRSITHHFNPSRSNSLKKGTHCQTKQDYNQN